jgi:hypothetical protein
MKLHFESSLEYQLQAMEAVCNLFRGQEIGALSLQLRAATGVFVLQGLTLLLFNLYYKVKQLISDLHADGFKSLSDFDLHFKKGLNVLTGPNGAGKTNICQALGLCA